MIDVVKQFVGALATPPVVAIVLVAVAVVCRLTLRMRAATWLLFSAGTIAYLGSITFVGDTLMGPLERHDPALNSDVPLPAIRHVVVLGSGYRPRDGIPVTAALTDDALVRIVEGVRLARSLGDVQLILSGGAPPGLTPSAFGYGKLAQDLGIEQASIRMLANPLDTDDEARAVFALLRNEPFILVTSAYHMPRAMRLLEMAGARPIPAPTGHQVMRRDGIWSQWLPSSSGLRETERAIHEYIGLAALAAGFTGA